MPDDPRGNTNQRDTDAQAVMEAVTGLREELDKHNIDHEKIERYDAFLDSQEDKNKEFVLYKKQAEAREDEANARVDTLEIEMARSGGHSDSKNYKESPEYKALNLYCRVGDRAINGMDADQKALLRSDSDVAGGFLTTTELDTEIIKKITEVSNIRSLARVRTIASKAIELPVRDTLLESFFEGEDEPNEDSTSTYSNETLNTFRQTVNIPISIDLMQNAMFDMEAELMGDAVESFAQKEGFLHTNGDGIKKPAGFLADQRITSNALLSKQDDTIVADDVIVLPGTLKVGYKPLYLWNRTTNSFLRTLRSDTGEFLWHPGLNGPVANTINGFEYVLTQDMPDIADGAFPIAFGDFQRGYTIIDRTGISVIRDELTQKKRARVEFTINRWTYGQVTLPEAIKVLQIS